MAGFLQLAGGTNAHTVDGLKKVGLFRTKAFTSKKIFSYLLLFSFSYIRLSWLLFLFLLILFLLGNSGDKKHSLRASIGGVAYGGYARKVDTDILATP